MSAPPYMKLYIADYLADTTHLTRDEHGAYLLLLMALWRAGGKLPRNPEKLARIARCTPKEWATVGPTIMEFFKVSGGSISQKRASLEIAKYESVIQGSKTAGKASASKRANKNNSQAPTDVEIPFNGNPTNHNHNQKEDREDKSSPVAGSDVEIAFTAWNATARRLGLRIAKDLTPERRKHIRARLALSGMDGWLEALIGVERSGHCRGENDRGWKADLDFVCQPKSFQRLREGFYGADAAPPAAEPDWPALVALWSRTGRWRDSLGPAPDQPDTHVPVQHRPQQAA